MRYGIITSARNEAGVIENTLRSVCDQTIRPVAWLITDDGSTDATGEIVEKYARTHTWIRFNRRPVRKERSFGSKAEVVNLSFRQLEGEKLDVVVNLDADVSFAPDYFQFLISKFEADPRLGIAGTPFTEQGYDSSKDSFEGDNYVAGPCQAFRTSCFQEIGGYVPNRAGGVDWIAVMSARMKGWTVRAFPEKRFHHHRTMGTAERGPLHALYTYGEKDYYLGGSPVWEIFRVLYRMTKKPLVGGGIALLLGYTSAAIRRVRRPVTLELMRFHRRDQMRKLRAVFTSALHLHRIDSFSLTE
ncbi:MAG TPA: glycosyltransferase family 2 protein [Opitutaceae bacterium]|jgi:glycosyltransferase involved in cell wall biosynthesis